MGIPASGANAAALAVLLKKLNQFHFLAYFSPNEVGCELRISILRQKEMSFTYTFVLVGSDVLLELLLGC